VGKTTLGLPSAVPMPEPKSPLVTPAERELGLQPAVFTPYDRYLTTVRRVITISKARWLDAPRLRADEARQPFRYV
jgi:hypothetical protein